LASGYGSTYRAVVVDNIDPFGQSRLHLNIPDVVGADPVWAERCAANAYEGSPGVGEEVTVVFEGANSEWPVWLSATVAPAAASSSGGGAFRATVVNPVDPEQAGRLQVTVPDVAGADPLWARPTAAVAGSAPALASVVWVQFEGGSRDHPMWIGVL